LLEPAPLVDIIGFLDEFHIVLCGIPM
jgi:hypothetical protein